MEQHTTHSGCHVNPISDATNRRPEKAVLRRCCRPVGRPFQAVALPLLSWQQLTKFGRSQRFNAAVAAVEVVDEVRIDLLGLAIDQLTGC